MALTSPWGVSQAGLGAPVPSAQDFALDEPQCVFQEYQSTHCERKGRAQGGTRARSERIRLPSGFDGVHVFHDGDGENNLHVSPAPGSHGEPCHGPRCMHCASAHQLELFGKTSADIRPW